MKRYWLVLTLAFCSFISTDNFDSLCNLAGGTWQMKTKNGYYCEQWTMISGTELNCRAFKVSGKDTTPLEYVKLLNKDGIISYNVTGAKSADHTSFKLISAKSKQFIFSNPKHDFPQRVIYHFVKPDSLHAWVDGTYKGKHARDDFYYKRVK